LEATKQGKLKAYNAKIIETPWTKEVWIYDAPILYRAEKESTDETKRRPYDELTANEQYDSLNRKQKHYEQMRWVIARHVDCNFDDHTKFVTLTFKRNITDIDYTNTEFNKFSKRLNYYIYSQKRQQLKYIATWEKQKRGATHYHVIFFDFPYIRKSELERLWGHGFVRINQIDVDSKENRGRYLSKYFAKDLELKEHKKKAFFTSQNLKKPIITKLAMDEHTFQALASERVIFQKEYQRKTYISELLRKEDDPVLQDTRVRYLKIRK